MFPRMELVVTLLVVGTILLLAETVLPGLIAGILGALCLMGGIVAGYMQFGARTGNYILIGVLVALIGGFCAWVKFFPDSRLGRVLISRRAVGNIRAEKPELLHQTGIAFTQLRPSGTALINGKRVDVVAEGMLVEKDTPIKVVAIEGMRVVVRALPRSESATSPSSTHPSQIKTT
jgi:membrane-bound serine protease (ClpP class)